VQRNDHVAAAALLRCLLRCCPPGLARAGSCTHDLRVCAKGWVLQSKDFASLLAGQLLLLLLLAAALPGCIWPCTPAASTRQVRNSRLFKKSFKAACNIAEYFSICYLSFQPLARLVARQHGAVLLCCLSLAASMLLCSSMLRMCLQHAALSIR
jgi:hypothetical protein